MELLTLILCVIPTIVTSISVSSNGNSPKIRMIGGMMMDSQKGFTPMKQPVLETTTKSNHDKSRKLDLASKLSINERYRRLIPYMTFYYANDIAPTTEPHTHRDVEVEKAEIVEAPMVDRQPKKIIYSPRRNVPRYQGNRLTQFNIASANPVKVYYKPVPSYQNYGKVTPNYNPLVQEYVAVNNNEYEDNRFGQRQVFRIPSPPLVQTTTRRPTINVYNQEDPTNPPYYIPERQQAAKFKLIPYEQAQPIKVVNRPDNVYDTRNPIPVPVLIPNDPVYIKPRPIRPQYNYDNVNYQQVNVRKVPTIVSENYYERPEEELAPAQPLTEPVIEDGFKPIVTPTITTEAPIYTTALPPVHVRQYVSPKKPVVQIVQSVPQEVTSYRPDYYQYEVDQPSYNTEEYAPPQTVTLSDLLNSLQLNKSIPKPITRENVGSSIRTLLQVLNTLKAMSQNEVEVPVLSTPKPFVSTTVVPLESMTPKSIGVPPASIADDVDLPEEPYLAPVHTPSQHLDDTPHPGGTSQRFPAVTHNGEEGGTPGKPGVDYPALTVIPHTSFDCKTQRYKGFFADTETRCQVWHYCDLNGGQASFLCPNGTIFSQAALTCDWWFNVRCASTTQLYVLNESLYKYILPHSPKFPEDYSGPLVDKYLTLKFKEMEEQFKKNKKQKASEKSDSEEDDSSEESDEKDEDESVKSEENDRSETSDVVSEVSAVSEASVLVESPGTSGNVERLQV